MKRVVFSRRITVFLGNSVLFSNRAKLAEAFPLAYVAPNDPYVAPQPILAAPPIPQDEYWRLQTEPFGGHVFQFAPGRIDTISNFVSSDFEQEMEHVRSLKDGLGKILNVMGYENVTRMAYVPVTAIEDGEDFCTKDMLAGMIVLPSSILKQGPYERSTAFTLNVEKKLKEKNTAINYFFNVHEGTKKNDNDGASVDCLIVENDINTKTVENVSFSVEELDDFFLNCVEWGRGLVDMLLEK